MSAPEPVFGTDGNDVLATALDKQWVYGLAGNDDLTSTGNDTSLDGGKGDDRLSTMGRGRARADQFGGAGADALSAEVEASREDDGDTVAVTWLYGDLGDDRITARVEFRATAINRLFGGEGDNIVEAHSEVSARGGWDDELGTFGGDGLARNIVQSGSGHDRIISTAVGYGPAIVLENVIRSAEGNDDIEVLAGLDDQDQIWKSATARNKVQSGDGDDVVSAIAMAYSNMGEAIATNDINLGSGNDTVELSTIVNAYDNYQDKLSETIVVPGDGIDEVNVDAVCYSEYDENYGQGRRGGRARSGQY